MKGETGGEDPAQMSGWSLGMTMAAVTAEDKHTEGGAVKGKWKPCSGGCGSCKMSKVTC